MKVVLCIDLNNLRAHWNKSFRKKRSRWGSVYVCVCVCVGVGGGGKRLQFSEAISNRRYQAFSEVPVLGLFKKH